MSRAVKGFSFSALAALVLAIAGIIWFIRLHGFAPETATLIAAWATIVSVVLAQIVAARLAQERAHADALLADDRAQADTLQAYFKEMGAVIENNPELRRSPPEDPNNVGILARAHTLTVLRGLNSERKEIVLEYLRNTNLIDTVLTKDELASFLKEIEEIRTGANGAPRSGLVSGGAWSEFMFIHQAMAANIMQNWTYLDHPSLNENPKAILWITPNWSLEGVDTRVYNNHPFGVWYEHTRQKWTIFNQDRSPMPEGTAFNVRGLAQIPQ